MLAQPALGAIWSSASPDFGVQGVLDRFGQIEPKVLICVDVSPSITRCSSCSPRAPPACPSASSIATAARCCST
jgi:acyl-coenzyme A synthetase/AMP-(fatty) acid ligase